MEVSQYLSPRFTCRLPEMPAQVCGDFPGTLLEEVQESGGVRVHGAWGAPPVVAQGRLESAQMQ